MSKRRYITPGQRAFLDKQKVTDQPGKSLKTTVTRLKDEPEAKAFRVGDIDPETGKALTPEDLRRILNGGEHG